MFSSSLHKRPDWAAVPKILLSQQQPKWQESTLDNHDISIPIPSSSFKKREESNLFRIILLSAQELGSPGEALQRIERLFHQHGGRHVGIIFILTPNHAGTVAFMDLQLSLMTKAEMPILPLSNLTSLPTALLAFQRQLIQSTRSVSSMSRINPASALLPYCSTDPPIPEHARNIVTDICSDIPTLAQAATTVDGRRGLQQWLSEVPSANTGGSVADAMITFWEKEFIVD